MGWNSGSDVMYGLIEMAKEFVPENRRKEYYTKAIKLLEHMDWDCQNDCMGEDPMFDEALRELHPRWFDEDA